MQADDVAALTEVVAESVREEVRRVVMSGNNWKIVINGSATGDVRLVVEEHSEITRRCRPVLSR